jgi:outer membrane receptor protein involved in Fe transport
MSNARQSTKRYNTVARRLRLPALLSSAAMLAGVPNIAAAQSTPDPIGQSAGIADIVVTAGKQEEHLSKVAGGISVVTGAQLEVRAANSLQDYLALLPGLNLQSTGSTGFGNLEIRGVSPQSVGGTVATYIDEIPFGGSSAINKSGEYTPDLDPADLARVEVLKGPQGTLYGASSLGGVIQYVTKEPNFHRTEIEASEDLNFLNNGKPGTKLRAAISTPLVTDKLAIRVSGFYRHDPGYIDDLGLSGKDANYGNSWGFRGKLLYKPVDNLSIDLSGMIQNSITHGYNVEDLDPLTLKPEYGTPHSVYRGTPEGFNIRSQVVSATIKWNTSLGTLTSATSYSTLRDRVISDVTAIFWGPFVAGAPQGDFVSYDHPAAGLALDINKQETEELRFNSRRLGPIEFIVGGFFQHEQLTDFADYLPFLKAGGLPDRNGTFLGYSHSTGTLNEYAGFLNATYHITDRLDVTGGFRHSHIDQTDNNVSAGPLFGDSDLVKLPSSENANTYLGGIRWRLTDNVMLYGRAASGYRPGGGRPLVPGAPPGFKPSYSSDNLWSYEAGIKVRALGGKLVLDADGFWIDWSKIQTLVSIGQFFTAGNGGKARSRGAEVQAELTPRKGLALGANAALTDAKFTQDALDIGVIKGERLYYVPKWTATGTVEYSWAINNRWTANIGGDYSYRSNQLDATRYALPAYGLFNMHVGAKNAAYSVNLYVKNLANKRTIIGDAGGYFPQIPPFFAVVNPPRTIGLTFNQNF